MESCTGEKKSFQKITFMILLFEIYNKSNAVVTWQHVYLNKISDELLLQ